MIAATDTTDGYTRLNVGCGRDIKVGWINMDRMPLPGVDIVTDLDDAEIELPDDSVDMFLLGDVLEHLMEPLAAMQELHRIARPNAKMIVHAPHGASDEAWADPTHVRPMFPESFQYFGQPYYWRADYGYRGDWRVNMVRLLIDKKHRDPDLYTLNSDIELMRNIVLKMSAILYAVKPIRQPARELIEPVRVEYAAVDMTKGVRV